MNNYSTNAQKISAWCGANPRSRLTEAILLGILGLKTLLYADLRGADLSGADLRGAKIQDANLQGASLRDADLLNADLLNANLWGVDLQDANLWGADLQGANLRGAYLRGANIQDAVLSVMRVSGMPSGDLVAFPCPGGWWVRVGCWGGTPDDLRELVAADGGWPEARGAEIARRRPYLESALALVDLHVAEHPGVIEDLSQRWGGNN